VIVLCVLRAGSRADGQRYRHCTSKKNKHDFGALHRSFVRLRNRGAERSANAHDSDSQSRNCRPNWFDSFESLFRFWFSFFGVFFFFFFLLTLQNYPCSNSCVSLWFVCRQSARARGARVDSRPRRAEVAFALVHLNTCSFCVLWFWCFRLLPLCDRSLSCIISNLGDSRLCQRLSDRRLFNCLHLLSFV
jgi:hypothetical protein